MSRSRRLSPTFLSATRRSMSAHVPDIDPSVAIMPERRVVSPPLTPSKVMELPTTEPTVMVKHAKQRDVPVMVPVPACVRIKVSG